MQYGIQRIQREVRCPAMEVIQPLTSDGTGVFAVPGDYLEMISLTTADQVNHDKLVRRDVQTVIRGQLQGLGIPRIYCRQGFNFLVAALPPVGTTLYLNYYQDSSGLVNGTDSNWLTDAAPDLLAYAALTYAADFFLDERAQAWEQKYQTIKQSLIDMGTQDELENASIGYVNGAIIDDGYSYYGGWY